MAPASYHPAPGWWRAAPARRVLWAAANVEAALTHLGPHEHMMRRWHARLWHILQRTLTEQQARQVWQYLHATTITRQEADAPTSEPAELAGWLDAWAARLGSVLLPQIVALWQEAAAQTARTLGTSVPPGILAQIGQSAMGQVRDIPETLRAQLRILLREAFERGRGPLEFARTIRQLWATASRQRAEVIARTEWIRVAGETTLAIYRTQGRRGKAWLTAGDNRVCRICTSNAAAGIIPIGHAFPSGHQTVPAHPVCRCTLTGTF